MELFTEHIHTPLFNKTLSDHPALKVKTNWSFKWENPKFVNPVSPLKMPKQRKASS